MPTESSGDPQPSATPPALERTSRPAPPVDGVPSPSPVQGVTGEVPQDLLDQILADAAQRSGLDASAITVQVAQAVEWSDSSLGCAKPGTMYMPVITNGYQVLLQAGEEVYDYRADDRGFFLLCE